MTQVVKNPPANAGNEIDAGLIPESGRSPGVGNSNPLQYSCLGNPMDRGAWGATVYGVSNSWAQLSMHAGYSLQFHLLHYLINVKIC